MPRKDSRSSAQATDPLPGSPAAHLRSLIVVGVSSSTGSRSAVRWAAAEAERRMAGLCIVHAYQLPQLGQPVQHNVDDFLRAEAADLLDGIADGVRGDHPQLDITTRLIQGAAVNALRDESAAAALTVVGAKESGRLARAILGSVASAIAAVNPAPVAVVHPDHAVNGSGPIVVGVDESAGNSAAIEFAFVEAAARKTEVMAVHAWNTTVLEGGVPDYPSILAQNALEARCQDHALHNPGRMGRQIPRRRRHSGGAPRRCGDGAARVQPIGVHGGGWPETARRVRSFGHGLHQSLAHRA